MQTLQQLLGKEDRFFQLLASSAEQAHAAAQVLRQFLTLPPPQRNLLGFAEVRRKDKAITGEINESFAPASSVRWKPRTLRPSPDTIYKSKND